MNEEIKAIIQGNKSNKEEFHIKTNKRKKYY